MKYLRVLQEIGALTGDPALQRNKDKIKIAFGNAVASLMPEAAQEEIPGYYKLKTDLTFASNPADLQTLQLLEVKSVFLPPSTAILATVTILSVEQIKNMAGVNALQPTDNDVFIYRVGNNLYAIVSSGSVITLASQVFHLYYLQDFQSSAVIAEDYDFSSTTTYMFSSSFTRKVINLAAQLLSGEKAK